MDPDLRREDGKNGQWLSPSGVLQGTECWIRTINTRGNAASPGVIFESCKMRCGRLGWLTGTGTVMQSMLIRITRCGGTWSRATGLGLSALFIVLVSGPVRPVQAAGNVFTIAKYPIEATASDAVTAKKEAMADGQINAFHSLLKRLVPVTAYRYLPKPALAEVEALTDGLNIRSEQNSPTEYLGEFDFRYNAAAVRKYLQQARLPYMERQAPETLIVPVYRNSNTAAPRYLGTATGQRSWREAWAGLDLKNALTPVKLATYKLEIRDDVRQRLVDGDMSTLRIFQQEYGAARILLAYATPDASAKKLNVIFVGQDAIGQFHLKRSYVIEDDDLLYTAELAAIIGLGVLEGRWKAVSPAFFATPAGAGGAVQAVRFFVSFNGLGQWQLIRGRIANLPGVNDLDTGAVSARGAEVTLNYPGGMAALQQRIVSEGMYFTRNSGNWLLLQN